MIWGIWAARLLAPGVAARVGLDRLWKGHLAGDGEPKGVWVGIGEKASITRIPVRFVTKFAVKLDMPIWHIKFKHYAADVLIDFAASAFCLGLGTGTLIVSKVHSVRNPIFRFGSMAGGLSNCLIALKTTFSSSS